MFDNIGKRIQTIFLIFIIVLLSVVMGVIGFGNPSGEGCNPRSVGYAASVYGETITEGDFRAAYIAAGFAERTEQQQEAGRLKQYLLEGLIERELLVREAQRLGFTVDEEEVMRRTAREQLILLSAPVDAPDTFLPRLQYSFADRDGNFSADFLRRFIQFRLRRSIDEFVAWQARETLADRVRETVTSPVTVSPREVWDAYVQQTDRATISYVRFNPADYRDEVVVEDAALTTWMSENTEAIDAEYRRQRHRYTNLEEQVRARHILIGVAQDASDADRTAARTRAEDMLRRAQAGEDFAQLARENSTDQGSAVRGGDLGYFPRGRMVAPFETAAFSHQEPALHGEVVESQFGFHVIKVEGRRQGNVPEAEARREIAEGLYRNARASELARAEADRALAYLREGHSTDELNEQLRRGWQTQPAGGTPAEGTPAEGGTTAEGDPQPAADTPERPRAPQVAQTSFGRTERALRGAFDSTPLSTAAFERTMEDPLPSAPVQLGDNWVVFRLDELTLATQEGLDDETRTRITDRLLAQKRAEVLNAYVMRLRAQAEADGAIRRNPEILRYGNEEGSERSEPEETASL
jgi:peptidyl-prolyl cis-trans isomerase D